MNRTDVSKVILSELSSSIDPLVSRFGFHRSAKSLECRRKTDSLVQVINFAWRRPNYADDPMIAYLVPRARLYSPQIVESTLTLVGDAWLLGNTPEGIMNESFGHLGSKRNFIEWRAHDIPSLSEAVRQVAEYAAEWVIPFLNEYDSLAAILRGYETGDPRLSAGESWHLRVAGIYLAVGDPESAGRVLGERFGGTPGLRERYKHAFTYLGL